MEAEDAELLENTDLEYCFQFWSIIRKCLKALTGLERFYAMFPDVEYNYKDKLEARTIFR